MSEMLYRTQKEVLLLIQKVLLKVDGQNNQSAEMIGQYPEDLGFWTMPNLNQFEYILVKVLVCMYQEEE